MKYSLTRYSLVQLDNQHDLWLNARRPIKLGDRAYFVGRTLEIVASEPSRPGQIYCGIVTAVEDRPSIWQRIGRDNLIIIGGFIMLAAIVAAVMWWG